MSRSTRPPAPDAIATLAGGPLAGPAVSPVTEGDQSITVTADKADWGRLDLVVKVALKPDVKSEGVLPCTPDSTTGQCTVSLKKPVNADQTIEANESAGSVDGPKVEVRVTAVAALGKPSIGPVNEGDDTVKVTLNSSDKVSGLSINILRCNKDHGLGECL